MERITGKLDEFCPLKRTSEGIEISFDYERCADGSDLATWVCLTLPEGSTIRHIKRVIITSLNELTKERILRLFMWKGRQVWLSQENQFNYKAAYDLAVQTDGENLPVTFKFGNDERPFYYEFKTKSELEEFYLSMQKFINEQIAIGWAKKDSINWDDYKL